MADNRVGHGLEIGSAILRVVDDTAKLPIGDACRWGRLPTQVATQFEQALGAGNGAHNVIEYAVTSSSTP